MMNDNSRSEFIQACLADLYGSQQGTQTWLALKAMLENFQTGGTRSIQDGANPPFNHRDAVLITYGDQVTDPPRPPLEALRDFLQKHAASPVNTLHILPFFPYSSDDGFSVIDYARINPELGDWDDVRALGRDFKLMFDAVINHISSQSAWFQAYLAGEPPYTDFFIEVDPDTDLSLVFRPRALPLLTPVETSHGVRHVWTTFSTDQIDLNFSNPEVLLRIIDILLLYAANQASILRLDAIAFLWKIPGTNCLHLPQTHTVIKLLRAVLEDASGGMALITETNVPHKENISYFGNGDDEAHAVYNFALPPLVLHTFHTGSAQALSTWAAQLSLPSRQVTFFNFLASHDGIGVTPARGILSEAEIEALAQRVLAHGGHVSYRNLAGGGQAAYELNINYFDALSDPAADEPLQTQIDRFLTAHAMMFSLLGMPGIYFHSLFGSRSWPEGVEQTGMKRSINRQKFTRAQLEAELANLDLPRTRVRDGLRSLLAVRAAHPAFDPYGSQQIVDYGDGLFCVLRGKVGQAQVLCCHNVSGFTRRVQVDLSRFGKSGARFMLSGREFNGRRFELELQPYRFAWLALSD